MSGATPRREGGEDRIGTSAVEPTIAVVVTRTPEAGFVGEALAPLGCALVVHARVADAARDPAALSASIAIVEAAPPAFDGLAALRALRGQPRLADGPILLIATGEDRAALRRDGLAAGASDVIVRPSDDPLALRLRAAPHLELARLRRETGDRARAMADETQRALAESGAREREIIRRLMLAAEFRDEDAGEHLSRVAGCVIAIAEGLGLSETAANDLALASTMHDVGKIGVPDSILLKRGALTAAERHEMMRHTVRGYRMLHGSPSRLLQLAAEIALSHHERWDGAGYPQGLAGTAIPLSARIVAVADVFDALISDRPYKRRWSLAQARTFLEDQAGAHFDPDCVAAFVSRWSDVVAMLADRSEPSAAA